MRPRLRRKVNGSKILGYGPGRMNPNGQHRPSSNPRKRECKSAHGLQRTEQVACETTISTATNTAFPPKNREIQICFCIRSHEESHTTILLWGKYKYKKLPMGTACAPDIFQEIMNNLLGDLDFVIVYLDDILIL